MCPRQNSMLLSMGPATQHCQERLQTRDLEEKGATPWMPPAHREAWMLDLVM